VAKLPTKIRTEGGDTPVYMSDKPCTACGCYQAYVFECNCGAVHSDVCYNCGGFVDVQHAPMPASGDGWSKPCRQGPIEHTHTHELT
jgi:hypothetical protein